MKDPFVRYLEKRADLERWPLVTNSFDGIDQVVVIPALAERDRLFHTLDSVAANPENDLARTLAVCVVNNRETADAETIENNQETLARLASVVRDDSGSFRLGYVDAASPSSGFSEKGGVGLARKIGLDWGIELLRHSASPVRLLISLDADTTVEPSYLPAIRRHFESENAWAGVVDYAHPLEGAGEEMAAIVCYELFLRYHVLGLEYAGSPYAFHTIGSTMVCRAEAYVAVSGMNRRQAGEDFYFLQELAKTGRVDRISGTTVYPSARRSDRVPFGTGARVGRFLDGERDEHLLYHPESYRILRDWLRSVTGQPERSGIELLESARDIAPELAAFLEALSFGEVWDRIRKNAANTEQTVRQFHRWFDGFRTIKLIHHLRDHGFPDQDMFPAIRTLFQAAGLPEPPLAWGRIRHDLNVQIALLEHLRRQE